eukprot:6184223-Pleurochrysis_carterae.AAC.1
MRLTFARALYRGASAATGKQRQTARSDAYVQCLSAHLAQRSLRRPLRARPPLRQAGEGVPMAYTASRPSAARPDDEKYVARTSSLISAEVVRNREN